MYVVPAVKQQELDAGRPARKYAEIDAARGEACAERIASPVLFDRFLAPRLSRLRWAETHLPLSRTAQQLPRGFHDPAGFESELLLQLLERRRGSERLHPDHTPGRSGVSLPAESRSLLDRDPPGHA